MIIINHDNNSEILKDIRIATSVEVIHKIATELGLVASHMFDMKWISLAETPTGEDIFVAREVPHIEYKGVKYPTRALFVGGLHLDEPQTHIIATESLSEALGENKEKIGTEENDIDCEIYFYVEDDVIGLDAEEICKNHLDTEFDFIEEEFE